jgi:hypothetical protein
MTGGRGIDIRVDRIAGSMVLLSPAVRTAMVKAAVEEPTPVLIDVDELVVPAASAWSVLTSADAGPQTEMYWNGAHIGRIYPVPGSTTVKRLT